MTYKTLFVLSLLLGGQLVQAQQDKYQEGVHYFKLDQAESPVKSDTVEVTEVFSYACSHCNTFEPYMQSWMKTKPENVKVTRLAVSFGRKSWEMMARGYIAAEMMGIADKTHVAMMDAVWKDRRSFRNVDDLADFYSAFGVEKDAFLAHYTSFAADSLLRKSQRDVQLFGVRGTPTIMVNRKFRIATSKKVPSLDAVLEIVDFLVAKESNQ